LTAASTPNRTAIARTGITVVALVVALLGAGCSSNSRKPAAPASSAVSTPSPTPSTSAEETQARGSVLAAYNGFREAHVAASNAGDVKGGDLAKYVADPLLAELKVELYQRSVQGLVTTGRPTWNARVTKVNVSSRPFTVEIEDCFDTTNWKTVDKKTGKDAAVPGQAKKYVVTAEAALYDDGRWLIYKGRAVRERPC
jgi:hypothetical protein